MTSVIGQKTYWKMYQMKRWILKSTIVLDTLGQGPLLIGTMGSKRQDMGAKNHVKVAHHVLGNSYLDKKYIHCKCFDHKNYSDWKLQGTCRENLHYLWKRAVRIAGKPCNNYRTNNYHGVSPQFLQPFSIDSADFPCRSPAISSPCSFYGQNICSVLI